MKELSFLKIKKDDIESKQSSLVLTTALSIVGLAALAAINLIVSDDDEDDKSEAISSED